MRSFEFDEILMAETKAMLMQDLGATEDDADIMVENMRDQGLFNVPREG